MSQPTRHELAARTDGPLDADSRIDALLVEGLDQYFRGRFEDAIQVWTRVLFLDRHHASARAYIERARGAVAERQRRHEEHAQTIAQLLDAGRVAEARRQWQQLVEATGADDRTAALALRLERLERNSGVPRISPAETPIEETPWTDRWRHWIGYRVRVRDVVAAVAVVAAVMVWASPGARARLGWSAAPAATVPTALALEVTAPTSGEIALVRARALHARGRLSDALVVLERIDAQQADREAADRLKVEIQRVLLAAVNEPRQGAR
jgi:hypothetical protein